MSDDKVLSASSRLALVTDCLSTGQIVSAGVSVGVAVGAGEAVGTGGIAAGGGVMFPSLGFGP